MRFSATPTTPRRCGLAQFFRGLSWFVVPLVLAASGCAATGRRDEDAVRAALHLPKGNVTAERVQAALRQALPAGTSRPAVRRFLHSRFDPALLADESGPDGRQLEFMLQAGSGFIYRAQFLLMFDFTRRARLKAARVEDRTISL